MTWAKNGLVIGFVVVFSLSALGRGFERYQVILDRKPFGEPPPAPVAPTPAPPPMRPEESFARNLRLSMIIREDTGELKVGIVDLSNNSGMSMHVGEILNGIELVSADYDAEEAVLRKGSEMAMIKLEGGPVQPINPNQSNPAASQQTARPAPQANRQPRRQRRNISRQVEPKYTGEELEQHLKDYQMEVIRQGLPPLPIPLTPEQDDQLVREGILPAVE